MPKNKKVILTEDFINKLYNMMIETVPEFKQFVEDNENNSIGEIFSKNYKKVSNIY